MVRSEIYEAVRDVLRKELDHHGEIEPSTRLVEDLELDSLRLLTLVVGLEDRFEVALEEGDEEGVLTVADLVGVLERRLAS